MRELVRNHPIVSFYVLAFGIGFVFTFIRMLDPNAMVEFFSLLVKENFHPNIFTTFSHSLERPVLFTGYLFPMAPSLAAILVVAIGWRGQGIRNLFTRFKPWLNGVGWRRGLRIYFTLLAVYLAVVAWVLIEIQLNGRAGALQTLLERYSGMPLTIVGFMAIAPFLNHGALFEELGWRGYMQPQMLAKYSPLKAVLLIGLFWGLWHLPRDIPGLLTHSDAFVATHGTYLGFLANQAAFIIGTISLSICIMYVVNLTGGSVLAAIFIHGMSNELSVGIGLGTGTGYELLGRTMDLQDLVVPLAALLILVLAGPRLGYRTAPKFDANER